MGRAVTPSRAQDELLLEWLRLRDQGITTPQIGALYGVTCSRVRIATNRVYAAMEGAER